MSSRTVNGKVKKSAEAELPRRGREAFARGLAPVDSPGARILVLGSFPSRASLERGEYYGHPRNHFWPLLAACEADLEGGGTSLPPGDWEGKKALLARLGLALWDLVGSCERPGSLDADIGLPEFNPVLDFILARPDLRLVAFNGAAAASFFARGRPGLGPWLRAPFGTPYAWLPPGAGGMTVTLVRLPSTSPIPSRAFPGLPERLAVWKTALGPPSSLPLGL